MQSRRSFLMGAGAAAAAVAGGALAGCAPLPGKRAQAVGLLGGGRLGRRGRGGSAGRWRYGFVCSMRCGIEGREGCRLRS
ncbi:hypothetical protein [Adlercreutzia equolifaciens]|uniref:hypothetical protein n=1 Tax=Adlercreutzia equolifaciens TaxID=446660 RepID=UPI0034D4F03B